MTRRKARQTRRAKRMTRRNRGVRKTVNVNRALTPFAQRYITKLKYSAAATLSLANSYSYTFNLNSCFDPDRTGGGHQPYGYDQLTPIYNRYRVIACSYSVTAYNGSTPIRFGVLPSNEIPPISNMDEVCENPRGKWSIQVPGGDTQKVNGRVYIPSLVGRNKAQYMADDRFQATTSNSPQELALLNVYAQSMSNVGVDVNCTITLNYLVEFFDAHPLDQS